MRSAANIQPGNAHLVARLKLRDRAAFADFYDRYGRVVYNLCYRLMGTAQDAEDLTQEAFLKAYRGIAKLRDPESLAPWLYRLTYNLCMDTLRRKKTDSARVEWDAERDEQVPLIPAETPREASPEHQAEADETREQVVSAMQALPHHYQTALILREMEKLSYDEIARVLETTIPAVETLLIRARDKFRLQFLSQQIKPATQDCVPYSAYLAGWYDDALPARRRARVSEHLEHCGACRAALHEIGQTANSYRALAPLLPPLALRAALLAQVAGLPTVAATAGVTVGLGTAAVSVAVAAAIVVGVVGMEQGPSRATPALLQLSAETAAPVASLDPLFTDDRSSWISSGTPVQAQPEGSGRSETAPAPLPSASRTVHAASSLTCTPHSTPFQSRAGLPTTSPQAPGPQGPSGYGTGTPQGEKGGPTEQAGGGNATAAAPRPEVTRTSPVRRTFSPASTPAAPPRASMAH